MLWVPACCVEIGPAPSQGGGEWAVGVSPQWRHTEVLTFRGLVLKFSENQVLFGHSETPRTIL